MSHITATKRKLIGKEMRQHTGTVTRAQMQALSSRHQVSMEAVRDYLGTIGFFCEQLKDDTPKPEVVTVAASPKMPLSEPEVAMLRSCKLYRDMGEGEWVLIKRSHFEKEREAINKLINAFT